ncbi:MAG: hypothetical protein AAFY11_11250 [Cyanobacteria bacterium J06641_5]
MQNPKVALSMVADRALAVALAACSTFVIGSVRIYQQQANGSDLLQETTQNTVAIPHQAQLWGE